MSLLRCFVFLRTLHTFLLTFLLALPVNVFFFNILVMPWNTPDALMAEKLGNGFIFLRAEQFHQGGEITFLRVE